MIKPVGYITRGERLSEAKDSAIGHLDRGNPREAYRIMLQLGKLPQFDMSVGYALRGTFALVKDDVDGLRAWISDFN